MPCGLRMSLAMRCWQTGQKRAEFFSVGVIDSGQVIDQGIKPDVGDVIGIEGQRDAPFQAALGTGDAKVLQRVPQETQDLVAVALRADEIGVCLDMVDQPLLVLCPCGRSSSSP